MSRLFGSLCANDLLLADRYYCSYAIVMHLRQADAFFLSRNHPQKKADFRRGIRLGKNDHLIEWLKPARIPAWMTEEDYHGLPDKLMVREFAVDGMTYVTTLLDASMYSKKALAELYGERWKVELDFRTLKPHLHMEMLRCQSPDMAEKEVAVRFMGYNLIRATMADVAHKHAKNVREISFKSAVQLLDSFRIRFEYATLNLIQEAYSELAKAVVASSIGKRKRHSQPRAVKRRPKAYPLLKIPRDEAYLALKRKATAKLR